MWRTALKLPASNSDGTQTGTRSSGALPRSTPSLREGTVSMVVFLLESKKVTGPKTTVVMNRVVPLNVSSVLSGDIAKVTTSDNRDLPLVSPVTADGQAMRFNVYQRVGDPIAGTTKRARFVEEPTAIRDLVASYIATGQELSMTEMNGADEHAPFVFAYAYNVTASWVAKYGTVGLNVGTLSDSGFEELNSLPLAERLRLAFPSNVQRISRYAEWTPLMHHLTEAFRDKNVFKDTLESKELKKKKREKTYPFAPNMGALLRLSGNCRYEPGLRIPFGAMGCSDAAPSLPILAPRDVQPFDPPAPHEIGTAITQMLPTVYQFTDAQGNTPAKHTLRAEFEFAVGSYANGTLVDCQAVKNCALYAERLSSLGIYMPQWIKLFMERHPVPFEMLVGFDLLETMNEAANVSLSAPEEPFPAGTVHAHVKAFSFETERYVRNVAGIPIPRSMVVGRYGNETNSVPYNSTTTKNEAYAAYQAVFATDPKSIPLASSASELLVKTGFYCLDGPVSRPIPSATDTSVCYYAVPLAADPVSLPTLKKPDPLSAMPPELQPEVLAPMTPEEGAKLILETFRAPPKTPADWNQGKTANGTPLFLFFVLSAFDEAKEVTRIQNARAQVTSFFKVIEPAHAETLPPTISELRQILIAAQVASAENKPLPETAYAIAGLKRAVGNEPKEATEKKVKEPESLKRDRDAMLSTDSTAVSDKMDVDTKEKEEEEDVIVAEPETKKARPNPDDNDGDADEVEEVSM